MQGPNSPLLVAFHAISEAPLDGGVLLEAALKAALALRVRTSTVQCTGVCNHTIWDSLPLGGCSTAAGQTKTNQYPKNRIKISVRQHRCP